LARKKKGGEGGGGTGEWIVTYSDMVTLLLCFFAALFDTTEMDNTAVQQLISSLTNVGVGAQTGGNTLSVGKMADLGNSVMTLPSMDKGRFMGNAKKRATSLFQPDIKSNKARVTQDERGIIISLAADAFFRPASAEVDLEAARGTLLRVSQLLASEELKDPLTGKQRYVRIEGHTDASPVDPAGPWRSNFELSAARALNVLHLLSDLGANEKYMSAEAKADNKPLVAVENTPEAQAYNRRIDIVILDSGSF
jgi:chemotaxis protein MotB